MKIPENATSEWFNEQANKGTFYAIEWVRWTRAKAQDIYEKSPKRFWDKIEQVYQDHVKQYGNDVIATELDVDKLKKVA